MKTIFRCVLGIEHLDIIHPGINVNTGKLPESHPASSTKVSFHYLMVFRRLPQKENGNDNEMRIGKVMPYTIVPLRHFDYSTRADH